MSSDLFFFSKMASSSGFNFYKDDWCHEKTWTCLIFVHNMGFRHQRKVLKITMSEKMLSNKRNQECTSIFVQRFKKPLRIHGCPCAKQIWMAFHNYTAQIYRWTNIIFLFFVHNNSTFFLVSVILSKRFWRRKQNEE